MKIIVAKEPLLHVVTAISGIVPVKSTMPILYNILIEAQDGQDGFLRLAGTDLDISLSYRMKATVERPGAITIPAKKFVEIVRALPNSPITIEQTKDKVKIVCEKSRDQAGKDLLRELDCQMVLMTQGEKGMTLFERDDQTTQIPTVARQVFDVSGAGDTVISTFTLALAAGLAPKQAAILANFAAGIVVGEVGTATVPASRLKEALLDGLPRRTIRTPQ